MFEQPRLAETVRSPNMFFRVDDRVLRSALPSLPENLEFLKRQGVTTIISFEGLPAAAREAARVRGLKVVDCLLHDGCVPEPEQIDRFLALMEHELHSGETVLIHCMAGIQRTGIMAGFYLIRFHGMHPLEAYWEVDKNALGDEPEFKQFLLDYGATLRR